MASLDKALLLAKKEFPDFEIKEKSGSRLMKAINIFLKIITFGQMKTFMSSFTTTLDETIYTPEKWPTIPEDSRVRVLRHELVHMRQKKRYTFVGFAFLYLFFPFPIGLAYFRMKFEREAYEVSMRDVAKRHGVESLRNQKYRDAMITHFTGSQYFWMWPFQRSIEKWYDSVVELVENDL